MYGRGGPSQGLLGGASTLLLLLVPGTISAFLVAGPFTTTPLSSSVTQLQQQQGPLRGSPTRWSRATHTIATTTSSKRSWGTSRRRQRQSRTERVAGVTLGALEDAAHGSAGGGDGQGEEVEEVEEEGEEDEGMRRLRKLIADAADAKNQDPQFEDLTGDGGCLKKIIQPGDRAATVIAAAGAACDGFTPEKGNTIQCHYNITVLETGELISSSADLPGNKVFEFVLGKEPSSDAMKGWDVAFPKMQKGERAELICTPEYAYGEKGAPPKIPPSATLKSELHFVHFYDTVTNQHKVNKGQGPIVRDPANDETDEERLARWEKDIEDGTSPLLQDLRMSNRVRNQQQESAHRGVQKAAQLKDPHSGPPPGGSGHSKKPDKPYDMKDIAVRKASVMQRTGGFNDVCRWLEGGQFIDVYFNIPPGTRGKQLAIDISTSHLTVKVNGEVITEGALHGKVDVDASYWLLTDAAPRVPKLDQGEKLEDWEPGAWEEGMSCVQVYLEKKAPFDYIWGTVYDDEDEDEQGEEVSSPAWDSQPILPP